MAKTPKKKNKGEVSSSGSRLDDVRADVLGLSESIEELKTSGTPSAGDSLALANSIQSLRQELRQEVSNVARLVEQAQIEHAQSVPIAPEVDTSEFSSAVDGLRSELHREVQGLSRAIAHTEPARSGSPMLSLFAILAALGLGIVGTLLYDNWQGDDANQLAALSLKLDAMAAAETQGNGKPEELSELSVQLADLKTQIEAQDSRVTDGFAAVKDDLANEVSKIVAAQVDVRAKPADAEEASASGDDPKSPDVAKDGAAEESQSTAKADAADGEDQQVAKGDDSGEASDAPLEKVINEVASPVKARIIIDNPSQFAFKLLLNDKVIDVKAGGKTSVSATRGTVTTQTPGFPKTANEWSDWTVVDGEDRLTIKVESGNDWYVLR